MAYDMGYTSVKKLAAHKTSLYHNDTVFPLLDQISWMRNNANQDAVMGSQAD
jgi:hypothetical protein